MFLRRKAKNGNEEFADKIDEFVRQWVMASVKHEELPEVPFSEEEWQRIDSLLEEIGAPTNPVLCSNLHAVAGYLKGYGIPERLTSAPR